MHEHRCVADGYACLFAHLHPLGRCGCRLSGISWECFRFGGWLCRHVDTAAADMVWIGLLWKILKAAEGRQHNHQATVHFLVLGFCTRLEHAHRLVVL